MSVTDEPLDAYVNRPLAQQLVRLLLPTPVTPNQLTFGSLVLGTVAGVAIGLADPSRPWLAPLGALTLLLSMVLDCGDGQLARARGGGTVLGRIIDGYADYWVALVVHVGILVQVFKSSVVVAGHVMGYAEKFVFVLAAGVTMGVAAGTFDHHKQRFLAHTGASRAPESSEVYLAEAERARFAIVRAGLRLFALYVRTQQGPAFHRAAALAAETASDPARVAEFERDHTLLLRLHGLVGPTQHNAAIGLTACMSAFVDHAFVWYCACVIVGVNLHGLVLHLVQRRRATLRGAALRRAALREGVGADVSGPRHAPV